MLTKDDLGQIEALLDRKLEEKLRVRDVALDARFAAQERWIVARFDRVESRFDNLERRFDSLEHRFDDLDADVGFLTRSVGKNFARVDERLDELEG